MSEIRYETATVSGEPGTIEARGEQFIAAIDYAFLTTPRRGELTLRQLDRFRAERTRLTMAFDDAQPPRSVSSEQPVATFGAFDGSLCVREGMVIPSWMITEVTVRGTHRRRGILSTMMRASLRQAREQGFALAALTASEGAIYGRFGFGVAAYGTAMTVRAHHGLQLRAGVREHLESAGFRVILPSWEGFRDAYDAIYPRFQRSHVGQIGNTEAYRQRASGSTNAWARVGISDEYRPMLVLDRAGEPAGFALAVPDGERRLRIGDIGALTPLAELALWDALAATDLVGELVWEEASVETPLRWALANGRDLVTGEASDTLWVRLLDLDAAFTARGLATDGTLILTVDDAEGFIGGSWVIDQQGGCTRVERLEFRSSQAPAGSEAPADSGAARTETVAAGDTATAAGESAAADPRLSSALQLRLDAEALASLYLGAVDVRTLVALGRAHADSDDLPQLERLLAAHTAPRNTYHF